MTTTPWLDADEQRAWRGWLDVHAALMARINRDLQASSGLSAADYEILVTLTDPGVEDNELRMYELGERLQWEKSRASKQVSRMQQRELLGRRECADDRRGAFVALTDAGRAALESAAPGHVETVRSLFLDALSREQVLALAEITAAARDRLAETD